MASDLVVAPVGRTHGAIVRRVRTGGRDGLLIALVEVWGAGAERADLEARLAGGIAAAFERRGGSTTARVLAALTAADRWLAKQARARGVEGAGGAEERVADPGAGPGALEAGAPVPETGAGARNADAGVSDTAADDPASTPSVLGAGASVLVVAGEEAILAQVGPAVAYARVPEPGAAPAPARHPTAGPWLRRGIEALSAEPLWRPLGVRPAGPAPRGPLHGDAELDLPPPDVHWAHWWMAPGAAALLTVSRAAAGLPREVVGPLLALPVDRAAAAIVAALPEDAAAIVVGRPAAPPVTAPTRSAAPAAGDAPSTAPPPAATRAPAATGPPADAEMLRGAEQEPAMPTGGAGHDEGGAGHDEGGADPDGGGPDPGGGGTPAGWTALEPGPAPTQRPLDAAAGGHPTRSRHGSTGRRSPAAGDVGPVPAGGAGHSRRAGDFSRRRAESRQALAAMARAAAVSAARTTARVLVAVLPNRSGAGQGGLAGEWARLSAAAAIALPPAIVLLALVLWARNGVDRSTTGDTAAPVAVAPPGPGIAGTPLSDLTLVAALPGAAGDPRRVVAPGGVAYVLNVPLSQVHAVAGGGAQPALVRGQAVGDTVVGAIVDLFALPAPAGVEGGRVVALDAAGNLWTVDGEAAGVPRAAAPAWIAVTLGAGDDGQLYALDRSTGQVYRYTSEAGAFPRFSAPGEAWLNPSQPLADAIDVGVDGPVFVLMGDGRILKFAGGSPVAFAILGLDAPLVAPSSLQAAGGRVLATDPGTGRIVVLGADGAFQSSLVRPSQPLAAVPDSGAFAGLHDAWWDVAGGTLFVAAGDALFRASYR